MAMSFEVVEIPENLKVATSGGHSNSKYREVFDALRSAPAGHAVKLAMDDTSRSARQRPTLAISMRARKVGKRLVSRVGDGCIYLWLVDRESATEPVAA